MHTKGEIPLEMKDTVNEKMNTKSSIQPHTNNQASVTGTLAKDFVMDHEIFGEKFYSSILETPRLSGTIDRIRIMVSEVLMGEGGIDAVKPGTCLKISGSFRSYTHTDKDGKHHLDLFLFADTMEKEKEVTGRSGDNYIYLNGFLCKPPYFRVKQTSGRHITDLLIAVNRPYGKSDYIPVLAWGRLADLAAGYQVGDRIAINGRIQSRTYQKTLADGTVETREVYEISGNRIIRENDSVMEEREDA